MSIAYESTCGTAASTTRGPWSSDRLRAGGEGSARLAVDSEGWAWLVTGSPGVVPTRLAEEK